MTSLVNARFAEWTQGLDTRESMISIFSHIRDIPYSLILSVHDPKTTPEQMLVAGKGSCGPTKALPARGDVQETQSERSVCDDRVLVE